MDFSGLRAWQWMIIGTVAGAAVGFAWSNRSTDLDGRNGSKDEFRRLVIATVNNLKQNKPGFIRNIVVREPAMDPNNMLTYPVTYEAQDVGPGSVFRRQLNANAKNGGKPATPTEPEWKPSGVYAETPFRDGRSIKEYLDFAKLPYTDRTGNAKWMPMYECAAGGFVVIGLLWPASIQLMIRAGLAKAPPPRPKKEKSKHRTGEDVDEMLTAPTPKKVDAGALDALNDAMEASLASTLSSGGPRVTPAAAVVEPVSVLMSGAGSKNASDPTEQPAGPMTQQEKKDYAGDYYPVAKSVKKHDEAQ